MLSWTASRGRVSGTRRRSKARSGDGFASRIASVAGDLDVDRVILTGTSASLSERTHLARLLTERGHCVDYVYGEPETLYAAAVLHHLEGLPVLSVQPTRLSRGSAAMKRGLDVAVSFAGLVLLSPLFAIVAIRIKLDSPGPVFFRQPRAGRDGSEFDAVKFRTMVDGADAMRADVRQQSIHENGQGLLKLRDDPRITRFGAKLRRWSIDELPQLWNVLRGDMSLVGPRPLPLDEAPPCERAFRDADPGPARDHWDMADPRTQRHSLRGHGQARLHVRRRLVAARGLPLAAADRCNGRPGSGHLLTELRAGRRARAIRKVERDLLELGCAGTWP